MTSAPRSPRTWPQNGPASTREASSTRIPANGPCGSVIMSATTWQEGPRMASADRSSRVYQELAAHYGARGEAQVRDRFLVLAADAATAAGKPEEAERLRHRLLELNPHHMLRPYSSWSQALQSQDVKSYIDGLRRTYPPSSAENLLESVRGVADDEHEPRPLPSAALDATVPLAAADMPTPLP